MTENSKTCSYCDKAMLAYSAQSHCGSLRCRMKWDKEKQRKTNTYWKSREKSHAENIQKKFDRWTTQENLDPNRVAVAEVPSCNFEMEAVGDERIAAIEEHITSLLHEMQEIENGIAEPAEETTFRSPFDTPAEQSVAHFLGSMCALCNGRCCTKGKAHNAFIQRSTLIRVLDSNEDITSENIVQTYKNYIPKNATANSCIFHTDTGCCLSPELRANICDEFFCLKLNDFIDEFQGRAVPEKVMVVSSHECEIRKVKVIDEDGFSG
ncbi:MAG: hypothetical protein K6L81_09040 [Agarilytica sp.]